MSSQFLPAWLPPCFARVPWESLSCRRALRDSHMAGCCSTVSSSCSSRCCSAPRIHSTLAWKSHHRRLPLACRPRGLYAVFRNLRRPPGVIQRQPSPGPARSLASRWLHVHSAGRTYRNKATRAFGGSDRCGSPEPVSRHSVVATADTDPGEAPAVRLSGRTPRIECASQ